jgi:hypothetical protein
MEGEHKPLHVMGRAHPEVDLTFTKEEVDELLDKFEEMMAKKAIAGTIRVSTAKRVMGSELENAFKAKQAGMSQAAVGGDRRGKRKHQTRKGGKRKPRRTRRRR